MTHPPFETASTLTGLEGVRHGFFGRRGGVSEGDYASLNTARATGDDSGNVGENIHRAVMALRAGPLPLALVCQVHGTHVHVAQGPTAGAEDRVQADALVTAQPGLTLGIATADCAPILLADAQAGVIGAAHAGWKGAVGAILEKTLEAMEALGARRENIRAARGPTISGHNYEIGTDRAGEIAQAFPDAADCILTPPDKAPHFDIPALLEKQAHALGIALEPAGGCTYGAPGLYFSHRRATHEGTTTGRQIALIARE